MRIVALSGYARSGKDETAKVLVEEYGFVQVAFADKLREMLYALNPIAGIGGSVVEWGVVDKRDVQSVIDEFGWSGYKESPWGNEIRRLLQRLGTEAGRQTLWDTIWIDAAFAGVDANADVVVSDARFFNEFDACRARGGEVWRIERPGVGPANDHASEMEAVSYQFDRYLNNTGNLNDLRENVKLCYRDFENLRTQRAYERTKKGQELNPADRNGLRSGPASGHPLAPRRGDGSITSVNVPKKG